MAWKSMDIDYHPLKINYTLFLTKDVPSVNFYRATSNNLEETSIFIFCDVCEPRRIPSSTQRFVGHYSCHLQGIFM